MGSLHYGCSVCIIVTRPSRPSLLLSSRSAAAHHIKDVFTLMPPPHPPQAIQTVGINKSSGQQLVQLINVVFTQLCEPPPQAIQTIGIIKSSGRRLLQLINDILDAAKMKQGELVIKHERVNVRQLMGDVFDITQTLVTKHVKLVNEVRLHGTWVQGRMGSWVHAWASSLTSRRNWSPSTSSWSMRYGRMTAWTHGRPHGVSAWPHGRMHGRMATSKHGSMVAWSHLCMAACAHGQAPSHQLVM